MGPYLVLSFSGMALSYYERQRQITEQRDPSTMGGDGVRCRDADGLEGDTVDD